jgi:group I intron endonuclease
MTDDRALLPFDEGDGRLIRRQWHKGQQSGIYQIRNRHNGRVYIGKSRDIPSRWLAHCNALDRGFHVNDALQGDWEVYGERAFEFTVLEEVSGLQALQNAEARHLAAASDVYNVAQVFEWKGQRYGATRFEVDMSYHASLSTTLWRDPV